ncbi:hypothetical protein CHS0354_003787 [Potamilus streckersoni]|uniref:Uncharacterized protein n=1 Tax=Potamilus streckersoni TaxID=2493646 RepID=A0AAE0W6Z6_9BIVA|nr:hypothetical protein CHS0354_003787 [Potamilus streckersoni]
MYGPVGPRLSALAYERIERISMTDCSIRLRCSTLKKYFGHCPNKFLGAHLYNRLYVLIKVHEVQDLTLNMAQANAFSAKHVEHHHVDYRVVSSISDLYGYEDVWWCDDDLLIR